MASVELSMHQGLREEIMALKKRVIELETAEADCERLRNQVKKVKKQMNEEKSRMELDFMNQVSAISQANALKVEEVECQLKETTSVNRALSDQLEKFGGVDKKIQEMEVQQEKEIARIVDNKIKEIEDVQKELYDASKTKDQLAVKLGEAQTRVEVERKKVEELNTSLLSISQAEGTKVDALEALLSHAEEQNAQLQSKLSSSQADASKIASLEEQLSVARKENDKLKFEQRKPLSASKKDDVTLTSTVRDLRDKLRSRDSELNSKIKEIRELESKLKTSRSESTASLDLEKECKRLKKEKDAVVASRNKEEEKIARLESDYQKLKNKFDSFQQGNENGSALSNQGHGDVDRLKTEHRELSRSYAKLEMENSELREKMSHYSETSSRQGSNTGKRTSKIIQQLEQNMKRETHSKQAAVSAMKNKTGGDKATDIKIHSLKAELTNLKQELEWEKDTTRKLREEILEMKEQKVGSRPMRHSSSSISRGVKQNAAALESRTAVKGIIQNFEKNVSHDRPSNNEPVSMQRLMERADELPGLEDDLRELREALNYEREQVLDLEDELTRQCEINCALLKEISNLSCENDAVRKSSAQTYCMTSTQGYGNDQKEIDRLIMEVANVKSLLFNAEQLKSNLEERYNILTEKHQREVDTLRDQLNRSEKATRSISSRMEDSSSLDKQQIESMRKQLESSEVALEAFRNGNSVESKERLAEQEARVIELTAELASVKEIKASLTREKDSLSSEMSRMQSQNDGLEKRSTEQQEQFDFLQKTVDEKVQQFGKLRSEDKEEITRLREQVKSLEKELSETLDNVDQLKTTLKDKEDMESTVDELSRKNVQSLHAQINKIQKELTNKHVEGSETDAENRRKIAALEEAMDSMQLEMEENVRVKEIEIEGLKGAITDKERKALLLEKEKEQLILNMNDMMKSRRDEIDELQTELMEMSTRSANQNREVQTLKLRLEDSGYRMGEVDRLRAKVSELGDQLSSGTSCTLASDSTSLQIENNDLRQKLRDTVAERQATEEKLREFVADKGGSKQVQVLRERNAALKHEVEKLTKKMKKLTESFRIDSPPHRSNSSGNTKTTASEESTIAPVEATRF
ncbi:MAG: hypothetical protein SGILL_006256, partial [Bacillariaceae sp.]